jgi:hypothetical protein
MLNLSLGSMLASLDGQGIDDFIDEAERFLDGAGAIDFEWWNIVAGPPPQTQLHSGFEAGG